MTNNQLAENSIIQLLNSVKLARDNAERADNRVDHSFYYALTIALEELQERRKAAMESEPVAIIDQANLDYLRSGADADVWPPEREEMGDVLLYRHAQPAPVSYSDFEEFWSAYIHPLAQDDELKDFSWGIWNACASNSQPAPVVPEEMPCGGAADDYHDGYQDGWNACRAAMLNGGKP